MSDDRENGTGRVFGGEPKGFDRSPEKFRATHESDRFSGASGVLFEQAMAQTRMAICLCDPNAEDQPIVFANRAFRDLTGYEEDEIVGRNCRFLQGPRTAAEPVARLRKAIDEEEVIVTELLNYRKDGSSFWNALHIGPIYDDDGNLIYYFGSQWDVSDVHAARNEERHAREMARELSHRIKNMFAVISGIVNMTGQAESASDVANTINARIRALGRVYETTLDEASVGSIGLADSVEAVLRPLDVRDRISAAGEPISLPFVSISMIGLLLNELAIASGESGALAKDGDGRVELTWRATEKDRLQLRWTETGLSSDMLEQADASGPILERLVKVSGGHLERVRTAAGAQIIIEMPVEEA